MKRLLSLILTLLFPAAAAANPYFRLIDPQHSQPVAGALLAPDHIKKTSAAGLLPLVTHSPKDGCLFPSIVCEDWTPLAVGASMNAGKITFDVAPLANVLPWMLAPLPPQWQSLADGRASFSAGPVWEYQERTNKGYFRVFTGLALHF